MAKYEDVLISEYQELDIKKKDLLKYIENAAWRMFQLKEIDKEIKKIKGIWYKWIFMMDKLQQLVRTEKKAQQRFRKLAEEYWLIDERMDDIKNTLIKYYDKQIEEYIKGLSIKNVNNINDLLTMHNGKLLEHFEDGEDGALEA